MIREVLNRLIRTAGIYAVPVAGLLAGAWIFGGPNWVVLVWTLITLAVFLGGCYVVDSWAKRLPLIVALLSLAALGEVKEQIKDALGIEVNVYLSCFALSMCLEVRSRRERTGKIGKQEW